IIATERLRFDFFFINDDFRANFADDFPSVVRRNRDAGYEPIFLRHQISLPATPDDGIALAHQKAIARISDRGGVVVLRCVIEKRSDTLVAAIGSVEEHLPLLRAISSGFKIQKSLQYSTLPPLFLGALSKLTMILFGRCL